MPDCGYRSPLGASLPLDFLGVFLDTPLDVALAGSKGWVFLDDAGFFLGFRAAFLAGWAFCWGVVGETAAGPSETMIEGMSGRCLAKKAPRLKCARFWSVISQNLRFMYTVTLTISSGSRDSPLRGVTSVLLGVYLLAMWGKV